MKMIVTFITDLLFPPSLDELQIRKLSSHDLIALYTPRAVEHGVALCAYAHAHVSASVHLAKFHNHPHAVSLLAAVLTHHLRQLPQQEYLIIPMPLSAKRYRSRGYNQVHEIARHASTGFPMIHIRTDILAKTKATAPQTSLSRKERLKNQSGAFTVRKGVAPSIAGQPILLIDDVYTTGATMRSAYQALTKAGFRNVSCIALAH